MISTAGGAQAATAIGLGGADNFAVVSQTGITNTGATTITGDIGSPGAIVGAGTITLVSGVNHAGDGVTSQAQTDLVAAYNAASQPADVTISADLAGMTLVPGVYFQGVGMGLTGTVTLDAGGDPSAVFVFRTGDTLTTGPGSRVLLTNGAQPCNVFWQVASSATLGTTTAFVGTIMAMASISANTGATIDGRLLARTGAVTLQSNVITRSQCSNSAPVAAYAANVGPGAQGLVCPWGGQYDGVGLCLGTGTSGLTNPSPSPSATPSPGASASASPSASVSVVAAPAPSATRPGGLTRPPVASASGAGPRPSSNESSPPQVVATPSGGVDTGR